ncbi:hypothetical protein DH2020_045330 [Rehmannia glutinosa]|uniref:DUF4408 domain-containing protein n=1 Tax=Rehmannia glutinosa TaxID=99300 RepID=A0ABR0UF36_REHGL
MDSFNYHDIRVEKANAISRYRKIQKITTLFRLVELFVFVIVVSRFSTQFALSSLKLSGEYFRGITVTLISPRFVFLLGNAIVIVLFLKSGRFSAKNGEKIADFYEEYVEKCRKINYPQSCSKEEKKAPESHRYGARDEEKRKMKKCQSENLARSVTHGDERRREPRRSMTQVRRKSPDCGRKLTAPAEDEMSSEEFRRTVEAFIARQQRFLREEGDISAVVPLIES